MSYPVSHIALNSAAFVALIALSLYFLVRKRSAAGFLFSLFLFLLATTEIVYMSALNFYDDPLPLMKTSLFIESLFPASLMIFSLMYGRARPLQSISPAWWFLIIGAGVFPSVIFVFPADHFFISPDIKTDMVLFLGQKGYWFYTGIMIYCVIPLVNIEKTFASSSGEERWRMKYEAIGIIGIISVLIFYYSQGLLYRTINVQLLPVRSGVLILSSLFIWYSNIVRGNGVAISLSRHVVYRSVTLVSVGLYLLFLGLIGEGMRYFNVPFSKILTLFIAFASGLLILLLLFSERLRRKVRVYFSKHFFSFKHDYRIEWLKFADRLAQCRGIYDAQDIILTTYREAFELRGVSLHRVGNNENEFLYVSDQYLPLSAFTVHASSRLLSYFRESERVLNPYDGEYRPDKEERHFIQHSGAKIVVPLINNDRVQGLISFGERLIKEDYIYEDYDLMKTLARQAALALQNYEFSEEIAETREVVAMAKISSFVMHDLKNLASALSLLLSNAHDFMDDPEFQEDMIITVRNTVHKMDDLMQKLRIHEKKSLNTEIYDCDALARECVEEFKGLHCKANVVHNGTKIHACIDTEEMKNVLMNLLINASEAADHKGIIRVETGSSNGNAYVAIRDDGCGMAEEFIRQRLFKPFMTTKKKGLGIGLYQCKHIVDAHNGTIAVESDPGMGSTFTVYLPIADIRGKHE